ncbi:MAG: Cro/Cl family transcriptional regulator [Chitinophagaceae bacterium]|nr:Cro/Cl family transcriptional regulator [Chitinophagaceae bacterium]
MDYWVIIPEGIVQEIEAKCLKNVGKFTIQSLLDDLKKFTRNDLEKLDPLLFEFYKSEIDYLEPDNIKRALNKRPDNGVYLKKNARLLDLLTAYTFSKNWIDTLKYFEIPEKDIQKRKVKVEDASNTKRAIDKEKKELFFDSQFYNAEWYVLTPFFPATTYSSITEKLPLKLIEKGDQFAKLKFDDQIELYWFDYGIAVWCAKVEFSLQKIFEFSLRRREFFKHILDGNHSIKQATKEIIEIIHKKNNHLIDKTSLNSYALSIFHLLDSSWENKTRLDALKLFSNPSMLYANHREIILERGLSNEVNDLLSKAELDYLSSGIFNQEFESFSIPGIIEGFATWAGVSFHIQNKEKCLPCYNFIFFEVLLQSFWALISHYKNLTLSNHANFVKEHYIKNDIKKHISKIFSVLPREPIVMRLFKETIINTSRIDKLYQEFKELSEI